MVFEFVPDEFNRVEVRAFSRSRPVQDVVSLQEVKGVVAFMFGVVVLLKTVVSIRKDFVEEGQKRSFQDRVHIELFPHYTSEDEDVRGTSCANPGPNVHFIRVFHLRFELRLVSFASEADFPMPLHPN